MKQGYVLKTDDDKYVAVADVKIINENVKVFNLHVAKFYNYFVSSSEASTSVLVHNNGKSGKKGSGGSGKPKNPKQKTKQSGKEGATDIPTWAKGKSNPEGKSGKDWANDLMKDKYGKEWRRNASQQQLTEFSQLKKFGDRHNK